METRKRKASGNEEAQPPGTTQRGSLLVNLATVPVEETGRVSNQLK
uniref:Uncharacterized protein n=1 Tax=Anguilla anguilla TaxID=7936 RepID=A0A0E9TUL2_ANGAN